MMSPKANIRNNKRKQTAANSNSKAKSVQMQLKLTKNGTISLQKPINKHSSPLKNTANSSKRGRPNLSKSRQPPSSSSSSRGRSTATTTTSKTSNSTKPKPKGPPKYPKIDKN